MSSSHASGSEQQAARYEDHATKLSLLPQNDQDEKTKDTRAVEAIFITPQDPVIKTESGGRLPAVPLTQAVKLNDLKDKASGTSDPQPRGNHTETKAEATNGLDGQDEDQNDDDTFDAEAPLGEAIPPHRTHPLFPELPMYGPPTLARNLQCLLFRMSSAILSLSFLAVIVLGSAFTSLPLMLKNIGCRLRLKDPDARRPFYEEEKRRQEERKKQDQAWKTQTRQHKSSPTASLKTAEAGEVSKWKPTEGGKDPLICDAAYYARRVGLDIETFEVQTEDGFIIDLWHVYDPSEHTPVRPQQRNAKSPKIFVNSDSSSSTQQSGSRSSIPSSSATSSKYPVLLVHGLLQSAGAYCVNDEDSLAFYLCKSGYDVWLGNNRCGFKPKHQILTYGDPRMWAWNIRQMGVMDLPALVSRVLLETGFAKLGLVCHSQGTTETFVALAKEQRPDLGNKISVFCALAPAVYAGPLIGKMYFKFMRIISPNMFRVMFGIHSFIPFMMTMHAILPGRLYGALGYRVFSFLFNWTDDRWDQGLRDRYFQFSPVYVSAESMRWWLGRECFAKQKCILSTKSENIREDLEDAEEDYKKQHDSRVTESPSAPSPSSSSSSSSSSSDSDSNFNNRFRSRTTTSSSRGSHAWYSVQSPPFALWIAGSDELVDGRRLLRRFDRGREPHARLVHAKIIDEYEHLDVLWAIDAIEKVGREVKEVLWMTASEEARKRCRVPTGCEEVELWVDDR